jgi:hypothetical protein
MARPRPLVAILAHRPAPTLLRRAGTQAALLPLATLDLLPARNRHLPRVAIVPAPLLVATAPVLRQVGTQAALLPLATLDLLPARNRHLPRVATVPALLLVVTEVRPVQATQADLPRPALVHTQTDRPATLQALSHHTRPAQFLRMLAALAIRLHTL